MDIKQILEEFEKIINDYPIEGICEQLEDGFDEKPGTYSCKLIDGKFNTIKELLDNVEKAGYDVTHYDDKDFEYHTEKGEPISVDIITEELKPEIEKAEYKNTKIKKPEIDNKDAKHLIGAMNEISQELADDVNTKRQMDAVKTAMKWKDTGKEEDREAAKKAKLKAYKNNNLYNRWKKVKGINEAFLTQKDKKYFLDNGFEEKDLDQIEDAYKKCKCDLNGDPITKKEALKLLDRETFLSGLGRAAFHYTADRKCDKGEVGFDCSKLHESKLVAKFQENNDIHEIVRTDEGTYKIRYNVVEGKAKSTTAGVKSLPTALSALKSRCPKAEEIKESAEDIPSTSDIIENLVYIGFDKLGAYKPFVQRCAKDMMALAIEKDLAYPFDFGRGKGKYKTQDGVKIEDVVDALKDDEKAKAIAKRYLSRMLKK